MNVDEGEQVSLLSLGLCSSTHSWHNSRTALHSSENKERKEREREGESERDRGRGGERERGERGRGAREGERERQRQRERERKRESYKAVQRRSQEGLGLECALEPLGFGGAVVMVMPAGLMKDLSRRPRIALQGLLRSTASKLVLVRPAMTPSGFSLRFRWTRTRDAQHRNKTP